MVIRTLIAVVLLWAAIAFAQNDGANADSPLPCPHAAVNSIPEEGMIAMAGEGPDRQAPPGQMRQRRMERIAERGRQLERLRTRKLLELLDLPAQQEKRFLSAFRDMRKQHREIDFEQHDIVAELARLAREDKPQEDSISKLIDRHVTLEQQRHKLMDDFVAKIRDELTPVQLAKLIVFEDRFEREMIEKMQDFRQHRMGMPFGQPGGPGGPGGPHPPDMDSNS